MQAPSFVSHVWHLYHTHIIHNICYLYFLFAPIQHSGGIKAEAHIMLYCKRYTCLAIMNRELTEVTLSPKLIIFSTNSRGIVGWTALIPRPHSPGEGIYLVSGNEH